MKNEPSHHREGPFQAIDKVPSGDKRLFSLLSSGEAQAVAP